MSNHTLVDICVSVLEKCIPLQHVCEAFTYIPHDLREKLFYEFVYNGSNRLTKEILFELLTIVKPLEFNLGRCWNRGTITPNNITELDILTMIHLGETCKFSLEQLSISTCDLTPYFASREKFYLTSLNLSSSNISVTLFKQIVERSPYLSKLNLSNCSFVTDEVLDILSISNSSLLSLDVSRNDSITNAGLLSLFKRNSTTLKHLFLNDCEHVTDTTVQLINEWLEIETLSLSRCWYLSRSCLQWIVSMKGLKSLSLAYLEFLSDEDINSILSSEMSNYIETLDLQQCGQFYLSTLTSKVNLSGITTLKISGCASLTDFGFLGVLSSCTNIQHLEMARCTQISSQTLSRVITQSGSRLEYLDCSNCNLIDDSFLLSISQVCKNIRVLHFDNCYRITQTGISHIGKNCDRIESLSISCCISISELGLIEFLQMSSNLKELDISYCKQFGNETLIAISGQSRYLEKLNLRGCTRMGDKGFLQSSCSFSKLVFLDIYGLNKVTDSSLINLGGSLATLVLPGCGKTSDIGLQSILMKNRKLIELDASGLSITDNAFHLSGVSSINIKKLDLSDCTHLTDAILDRIWNVCPFIETLVMNECNISESALHQFTSKCSNLKNVYCNSNDTIMWENEAGQV